MSPSQSVASSSLAGSSLSTSQEGVLARLLEDYERHMAAGDEGAEIELKQKLEEAGFSPSQIDSWISTAQFAGSLRSAWSPARPTEAAPLRLARFELLRELGRGGFGIVYLARDPMLGRQLALKVPRGEALMSPELRARFLEEARVSASFEHPNIVPVYEAAEIGPICYIASAYCPGEDLARHLASRTTPFAPREAAALIAQLADAAAYTHARGVVHRDLKPSNVMLSPRAVPSDGASAQDIGSFTPRLTDFGLAKIAEKELITTRTSMVLGTPLYMAPEQTGGSAQVGPAVDIYSLGAILYELLTLKSPVEGATLYEVLENVRNRPPAPLRKLNPQIARDLELICMKCLEKRPADRYASAAELAADLRRYLAGEAIAARPIGWAMRFWNWTSQVERMRDAGILIIALNLVMTVWVVGSVSFMTFGLAKPSVESIEVLVLTAAGSIVGFLMPHMVLGYFTMRGSPVALWIGMVMFGLHELVVAAALLGLPAPFVKNYTDPVTVWSVYTLLAWLYFLQLAAVASGMRAYYAHR